MFNASLTSQSSAVEAPIFAVENVRHCLLSCRESEALGSVQRLFNVSDCTPSTAGVKANEPDSAPVPEPPDLSMLPACELAHEKIYYKFSMCSTQVMVSVTFPIFFAALNIPPPCQKTMKKQEREVGTTIEPRAKKTCAETTQEEARRSNAEASPSNVSLPVTAVISRFSTDTSAEQVSTICKKKVLRGSVFLLVMRLR